jgi:hypothetical protein
MFDVRDAIAIFEIREGARGELCNADKMALKARRGKAERDNPKQLTPEELTELEGKPVFIKYLERIDESEWKVIKEIMETEFGLDIIFTDHTDALLCNIGITWDLYPCEPTEDKP